MFHFNHAGSTLLNPTVLTTISVYGIQLTSSAQRVYERAYATLLSNRKGIIDFAICELTGMPYPFMIIKDIPYFIKSLADTSTHHAQSQIVPRMAISLVTGVPYFLKVLEPLKPDDAEPTRQATQEYNHCKALNLSVDLGLCYSPKGVTSYLLLPFYPGKNVQALMNEKSLSIKQALLIARKLCAILLTWHRAKLLHMDIKPSNLLFDMRSDEVNIIDFQTIMISGTVIPEQDPDAEIMVCIGTFGYSHPDFLQALAHGNEVKCVEGHDVYACVTTLIKLLTYAHEQESLKYRKEYIAKQSTLLREHIHVDGTNGAKPVEALPNLERIDQVMRNIEQQWNQTEQPVSRSSQLQWRDSPFPPQGISLTSAVPVPSPVTSVSTRRLLRLTIEADLTPNMAVKGLGHLSIPPSPVLVHSGNHSPLAASPMAATTVLGGSLTEADSCRVVIRRGELLQFSSSPVQSPAEGSPTQSLTLAQ